MHFHLVGRPHGMHVQSPMNGTVQCLLWLLLLLLLLDRTKDVGIL